MKLYIFSPQMVRLGTIETSTSIQWIRNFSSCGEFETHFPLTQSNVNLLKLENLLWLKGKKECGVIEYVTIDFENSKREITVKGRFAESYYARRPIKGTFNFNGKVEDAMRQLVTLADIPNVELGVLNGFSEKIQFQATYKNTLTYLSKLSQSSNIGFRLRPDFDRKKWIFETYKGIDRSINQFKNKRVVFSQKNSDISKATYTLNSQNYSNVCYVGGQGEGANRQIEIAGDNSLTGLARREVFINGSDIEKDKLTDIDYKNSLIERGNTTLSSNVLVESLEKEDRVNGTYNYLEDYDLGDIVTNKLENWNIISSDRVVSVTEIYEHGRMKAVPTFGTPLPSTIDWSDNL